MKKHDIVKTIQLILFLLLTLICGYVIFTNEDVYHIVSSDPSVRLLCALLWVALALSFVFIFFDFSFSSSYKKDYRELDYAVYSDPVSGIANRFSCDALIEKYLDKPLPDNIGCIMFDLVNISEINRLYGHVQGNELIRAFSNILKMSSVNLCFVGRNGGNKFLAMFEDCTDDKISDFLSRVNQKSDALNSSSLTYPISYRYGIAFHEKDNVKSITDLIALSNRRINDDSQ